MTLRDIPKGSKIKAEVMDMHGKLLGNIITFHHLDGMYSYCTVDGVEGPGSVCHLGGSQPLKKVGDYYELVAEEED